MASSDNTKNARGSVFKTQKLLEQIGEGRRTGEKNKAKKQDSKQPLN